MAIEVDHTSIVMVGMWNPGIINPQWLQQHEIVKRVPTGTALGFQPLGRTIRFELEGMAWEVSDSRLAIRCESIRKSCGTYAAKVLELLSHTPMEAIGTNFVFTVKGLPSVHVPRGGNISLPGQARSVPFSQVSWQGVADLDKDTVLNLTVTKAPGGVVLALNFHRNCSNATEARKFTRRWHKDRSTALTILHDRFGVDLP